MQLSSDNAERLFFEAIPFAAYVIDPVSRTIRHMNENACILHGRIKEQVIGLSIDQGEAMGMGWLPRIVSRLDEERPSIWTRDYRIDRGRRVPVEISAALHLDGEDAVVVMVRDAEDDCGAAMKDAAPPMSRDERRRLEIEHLRALVDATANPMMLLDSQGRVVTANAAMARIAGVPVYAIEGLLLEDIFDADTAAIRRTVIQDVFRSRQERTYDEIADHGFYRIHVAPVLNEQSDVALVAMNGVEMTETVSMQREVIDRQRFHAGIMDAIQDGLEVVGANKRIQLVNETFREWFGHLGPLHGRRHEIVHGPNGLDSLCPVDTVLQTGVPAQVVRPFSKYGEEDGWLEVFSFPLFGADGEIQGAVQHCRDITEKVFLERRLSNERRRFREYYDFSPVGITTVLPTGQRMDVNAEYCAMLGYSREEVLTMHWSKLIHADDRHEVETFWKNAKEGVTDEFHDDIRYLHRDGRIVHANVAVKCIRDESGEPEYMLVVVQDITARKTAEEELLQIRRDLEGRVALRTRQLLDSESNLRALLNAPVVSAFLLDADHTVLAVNDLGAERLAATPKEVIGRKITEFFPPGLAKSRTLHMQEALSHEKMVKFQDRRNEMIFDVTVYPIRNRKGQVTRLAVFAEDVTRTYELERQLLQAHKMEALGIMAGGIAHDFNNILGIIITNAELLGMGDLGDKAARRLSRILDASGRAREIVRQILTFSRSGSGERRCIALGPVIAEFAELTRASLPSSINFRVHTPADNAMMVDLDSTQLQQLLLNLCVNAEQAMEKNGGELTVRLDGPVRLDEHSCLVTYPELSPGSYARLQVADTGAGIPDSIIERIFEPFFTTKSKDIGTGLGLSMVHGIVRRHGGAVRVRSDVGKGTEFTVLLPLHDENTELASPSLQRRPPETERILFLDDDAEYRSSIAQALESMGYEVVTTGSAQTALKELESGPDSFGLVLTDQIMPGMSGMEFAEHVRDRGVTIPILLGTGYGQHLTEAKLIELDLGLLMKPFTMEELERAIRNMLKADKDRDS